MDKVTWKVTKRTETGKGVARKLRATGKLPGNAYGKGLETVALTVETELVNELIREGSWNHAIIELEGEGLEAYKGHFFIVKEMQRHHIQRNPLTVDLKMIRLDEKMTVEVPLIIHGAESIKARGGLLDVQTRVLPIECLPTNIPTQIEVDATDLEIGATIHVSHIALPEGAETALPADHPICTATVPRAAEEAEVAEDEEGVEGEEGAEPTEEKTEEKTD
jgi:large subunit ribosomal protein L25